MIHKEFRKVRTLLRYTVYGGCIFAVGWTLFLCGSLIFNPFSGFAGESEFHDLAGRSARGRLRQWPSGVATADVETVSYKTAHSRDSYATWYRIKLSADAALIWSDDIHARQEASCNESAVERHEGVEGVHRIIDGPPPLRWQTGETPTWWSPPGIAFRSTEVMLWYEGFYSGVGSVTYSGYEPAAQILWIYDYACQHDELWRPGEVPDGDVFARIAR